MMKRFKKLSIISAVVVFSALAVCGETSGFGTRLDFINRLGERVASLFGSTAYILFNVFENEDGFHIYSSNGEDPVKLVVVPYGSETYTVNVDKKEGSEVEVYYKVLDQDNSDANSEKLTGETRLRTGTNFRIYVKVPEKGYPKIEKTGLYVSNNITYYGFDKLVTPLALGSSRKLTDVEYRKELSSRSYGNDNYFKRVGNEPGLWYFDTQMDNQPLEFEVDYEYADSDALKKSKFGVLENLYCQVDGAGGAYNCDETFMLTYTGDFLSQDMIASLISSQIIPLEVLDYNGFNHGNRWLNAIPWMACFRYITHSNLLLDRLDAFDVPVEEKEIAKAQLLTLRSHAYWRLLQLYAPRWSESNGGSVLCAPLETVFVTEYRAPATMKEIADQCYADLDKAIEIFLRSGYVRENIIEPDLNVARGVKMRLALLREDWATTERLSSEILQTVPLTTNEELLSGFFKPTDSWIWGAWNNQESGFNLYYYSFQHLNACNGTYPTMWGYGGNAIDRDLYLTMSKSDVRNTMFIMPENPRISSSVTKKVSNWYLSRYVDVSNMSLLFNDLRDILEELKPEGIQDAAYTQHPSLGGGKEVSLKFGAHLKFYSQTNGDNHPDEAVVFMRAEEVLLTHAEAKYRLGDIVSAIADLDCLNKMRLNGGEDPNKDKDVFYRIINARKLELWGEGHSWYDQKRWKMPVKRSHWQENNTSSGNWPKDIVPDCDIDAGNGWRMGVPVYYMQQNPYMNNDVLGYKDMVGYEHSEVSKRHQTSKQRSSGLFETEISPIQSLSTLKRKSLNFE